MYLGASPCRRVKVPGLNLVRSPPTENELMTVVTSRLPHAGQTAFSSRSAKLETASKA